MVAPRATRFGQTRCHWHPDPDPVSCIPLPVQRSALTKIPSDSHASLTYTHAVRQDKRVFSLVIIFMTCLLNWLSLQTEERTDRYGPYTFGNPHRSGQGGWLPQLACAAPKAQSLLRQG